MKEKIIDGDITSSSIPTEEMLNRFWKLSIEQIAAIFVNNFHDIDPEEDSVFNKEGFTAVVTKHLRSYMMDAEYVVCFTIRSLDESNDPNAEASPTFARQFYRDLDVDEDDFEIGFDLCVEHFTIVLGGK